MQTKNKYAVAIIYTWSRHEYVYGDNVTKIFQLGRDIDAKIKNPMTEWVEIRTYPKKSMMYAFVNGEKEFYKEHDVDIKFTEMNLKATEQVS